MPPMNLTDSVALVTGANRGSGACLVTELLRAGAAKVYATSRAGTAHVGDDPRARPLALDVTDPASVTAAPDVAVLVNNAGHLPSAPRSPVTWTASSATWRTNYLGTLHVTRAFVPALERNAPAAVVNVLTLSALAPMGPMAYLQRLQGRRSLHHPGAARRTAAAWHQRARRLPRRYRHRHSRRGRSTEGTAATGASRIVSALAAGESLTFPDDASAAAGTVYLYDPIKLQQLLTG